MVTYKIAMKLKKAPENDPVSFVEKRYASDSLMMYIINKHKGLTAEELNKDYRYRKNLDDAAEKKLLQPLRTLGIGTNINNLSHKTKMNELKELLSDDMYEAFFNLLDILIEADYFLNYTNRDETNIDFIQLMDKATVAGASLYRSCYGAIVSRDSMLRSLILSYMTTKPTNVFMITK